MNVQSVRSFTATSLVPSIRWWSVLSIGTCALMMTGCGASMPPSKERAQPDASLTSPCPPLASLTEKDGKAALRWMIETAELYNDCSRKHQGLVEATR